MSEQNKSSFHGEVNLLEITVREMINKLLNYPLDAKIEIEITRIFRGRDLTFNMLDLEMIEGTRSGEVLVIRDKYK